MNQMVPLVEVTDLDFAYRHGEGWLRVLHGVSFTIRRGEVFGLVGESGCGKSTLAYQLLGYRREFTRIERGRISFQGLELHKLSRSALDKLRGNRISLVPQNPTTALSPAMRIGRQLMEVLEFHGASNGTEEARATELLQMVRLPEPHSILQRYPHELSGGQQQRVCIAMALACEPDLIVLDEPTTGLDVTTQHQIIELLAELRGRLDMSMLYVTHDLGVLAQIADRVGVMYAGRMVEIAPSTELFTDPRHPYTRGLIASVPDISRVKRAGTTVLRGLLKRDELPAGCPFQPRCNYSIEGCASEVQLLDSVNASHQVACKRWRDLETVLPTAGEDLAYSHASSIKQPILLVENVSLGYGARRRWGTRRPYVVKDLSFTIEEGEIFALVGESGSGKSTIARAIGGLISAFEGTIKFENNTMPGLVSARSRELRQWIQYIFQNPDASLNPRVPIGSILARPIQMFFRLARTDAEKRVTIALEDVRLAAGYANRYSDQLSGGERQRVAIARAIVAEPKLLLCDEILSGLDVSVQANVMKLLQRLRMEHGLSMLFISHDLAVVRNLADRIGVLFRGQLMELGEVEDVFKPPFHPYTYELLMAVPSIGRVRRPTKGKMREAEPPTHQGCAFAGRCAWQVGKICEEQPPPWRQTGPTHKIRCHIPLHELSARVKSDLDYLNLNEGNVHQLTAHAE